MLVGQAASARTTGAAASLSTILPAVSIYGVLAVALVWLGIGSTMARRWARALLLIFSWYLAYHGSVSFFFHGVHDVEDTLFRRRSAGHPPTPSPTMGMVMVFMSLVFGVLFAILPAVWTFFYSSRHVKATCETRDP